MCVCVCIYIYIYIKLLIPSGAKQVIFPSAFFFSQLRQVGLRVQSACLQTRARLAYQGQSFFRNRQRDDLIGSGPEHGHKGFFDERVLGKSCTKSSLPPSFQRYLFKVIPRKGGKKKNSEKKKEEGGERERGVTTRIIMLPGIEKGEKLLQVNCWMLK